MVKRFWSERPPNDRAADENSEPIDCIEGPVEQVGDQLMLRIPLRDGGDKLVECSRGWARIKGDSLEIPIHRWMASKLGIAAGAVVVAGNKNGKCVLWLRD